MKTMIRIIDRFFFENVSAAGFGLMRIAWAGTALAFLLGSAQDVVRYYSAAGIMPQSLGYLVFRDVYRFTLLDTFTDPLPVLLLWSLYVTVLLCTMLGVWTRPMTVTAVLLMFSFHERNLQPLGGGDTLLRNIGFILMIAPEIDAFSIDRLENQWRSWKTKGTLLPGLRTQIWPYRLLLWEFIIIYLTSMLDKTQGEMWLRGTSVAAVFHHTHFFRWPREFADLLTVFSPYVCAGFLLYETTWALMLVPRDVWSVIPERIRRHSLKRWLLAAGVFFHGMILILMDVGTFSFVMFTGYIGLLQEWDFETFKNFFNRGMKKSSSISVLYDGACRLCNRSMFFFLVADRLGRLRAVDFRDAELRKRYAPDISSVDLDRALHIRLPDGTTFAGFDAFRKLTWNIPVLWPLAPFLYIPGIPLIGRAIYAKIAARRNRCADGHCKHGK